MKYNFRLTFAAAILVSGVVGCNSQPVPASHAQGADSVSAPANQVVQKAAPATKPTTNPTVLEFANESIDRALAGKQTSTTRQGLRRQYSLGAATMKSRQRSVPIIITDLKFMKFSDLTADVAKSDGFTSVEDLKDSLRKNFPDIADTDMTTTVYFAVAGH